MNDYFLMETSPPFPNTIRFLGVLFSCLVCGLCLHRSKVFFHLEEAINLELTKECIMKAVKFHFLSSSKPVGWTHYT